MRKYDAHCDFAHGWEDCFNCPYGDCVKLPSFRAPRVPIPDTPRKKSVGQRRFATCDEYIVHYRHLLPQAETPDERNRVRKAIRRWEKLKASGYVPKGGSRT